MSEATTSDIIDNLVILRACEQYLIAIVVLLNARTQFASTTSISNPLEIQNTIEQKYPDFHEFELVFYPTSLAPSPVRRSAIEMHVDCGGRGKKNPPRFGED